MTVLIEDNASINLKICYELGSRAKILGKKACPFQGQAERIRWWDGYYDQMLHEDLPKHFGPPDFKPYRNKKAEVEL